jgi:hypothetical protein
MRINDIYVYIPFVEFINNLRRSKPTSKRNVGRQRNRCKHKQYRNWLISNLEWNARRIIYFKPKYIRAPTCVILLRIILITLFLRGCVGWRLWRHPHLRGILLHSGWASNAHWETLPFELRQVIELDPLSSTSVRYCNYSQEFRVEVINPAFLL